MTRIAVVEWFPRVCGVHTWALNVAAGFEAIGHDVARLTFTKSGHPLSAWGHVGRSWRVERTADAVDVLGGFDLVVLSDVVCRAPQVWKSAAKESRLPDFVDVLRRTRTPWTSMAHDACHQAKLDPTAAAVLALPNFTGVLITTVRDDVEARFGDLAGGRDHVHWVQDPYLPYVLRPPYRGPKERSAVLTARLASNKGQDFLFENLPHLGFDVHLWGDNPYGFPSLAWAMWERAEELGYERIEAPVVVGGHKHPNAVKFYTGAFAVRAGGNTFRYHGPFEGDPDWAPWLALNLTNRTMRGHLEYAQLDAMSAGCVVAAPEHSLRAPSGGDWYYRHVLRLPYTSRKESDAEAVLKEIRWALSLDEGALAKEAEGCRAELAEKHDAARVAQHFLDGVECYRRDGRPAVSVSAPEEDVKVELSARHPDVLVINTYAGSLLLGARAAGVRVVASLEDCGFGQDQARANFPGVSMVAETKDWPDLDLTEKVVIAHPPCAAFSIQAKGSVLRGNRTRAERGDENADHVGLNSPHFVETRAVVNYALGHGAEALAVESVPGAYEGARSAHDSLAEEHGYHVFRLLQNAATFGVPQWRPRFWAVFAKRPTFAVWHSPVCRSVSQTLDGADPGPADEVFERYLAYQRDALTSRGYPADEVLSTPGMVMSTLQRRYKLSFDEVAGPVRKTASAPRGGLIVGSYDGTEYGERRGPQLGYRFVSKTPRVLDPDGTAGVILGDTWFIYRGRNVRPNEYKAIMGFPRDYALDRQYRLWLSKGVCPPVAAWVLELLCRNVVNDVPPGAKVLASGGTADFRPTREDWEAVAGLGDYSPEERAAARRRIAGGEEPPPELIRKPAVVALAGPDVRVVLPPAPSPAPEAPEEAPSHLQEASDPAPAADPPSPPPRVEARGPRKRRVEVTYVLAPEANELTEAAVREAFVSARAVLPPLVGAPVRSDRGYRVTLQYEPPNAGGCRTDVDRIAARGAKKLGCAWRRA